MNGVQRFWVAAVAMLVVPSLATAGERKFSQESKVSPGGTLTVKTDAGSVRVTGSASGQVVVKAEMRGSESDLEAFEVSADQSGNDVTVTGKLQKKSRGHNERTPRIAQNTTDEKQRFENPLLPYTRSEIALPLIVGDHILGALDVQSSKAEDFGTGVIETMQNMASQVAVALENAHLFQETQQSINELRSIQKQYLLEGWTSIKSYSEDLEYGIGEPSETANQTMERSISLCEQILGQITLDSRDEWTPQQQSLVDGVIAQAAIALENARLVSESRQIALRERTLTEINSKIWSSASIYNILQTVVRELGRRLDVSNASPVGCQLSGIIHILSQTYGRDS